MSEEAGILYRMELRRVENKMSQDPKDRAKISTALTNVEKEKPSSMMIL